MDTMYEFEKFNEFVQFEIDQVNWMSENFDILNESAIDSFKAFIKKLIVTIKNIIKNVISAIKNKLKTAKEKANISVTSQPIEINYIKVDVIEKLITKDFKLSKYKLGDIKDKVSEIEDFTDKINGAIKEELYYTTKQYLANIKIHPIIEKITKDVYILETWLKETDSHLYTYSTMEVLEKENDGTFSRYYSALTRYYSRLLDLLNLSIKKCANNMVILSNNCKKASSGGDPYFNTFGETTVGIYTKEDGSMEVLTLSKSELEAIKESRLENLD